MMRNRKLNRLQGHDYAEEGYYFVTICAKDRLHWFGKIQQGKMTLNEWGATVQHCWHDLANHYANIHLDEFVIMPNHVHGIIVIGPTANDTVNVGNGLKPFPTTRHHGLPEIMRGFKTFSSRRINEQLTNGKRFQWQKSYYDRVVRGASELNRVRQYIMDNPLKWAMDPENREKSAPSHCPLL